MTITGNITWTSQESLSHAFAANNITSDEDIDTVSDWNQQTVASANVTSALGLGQTASNKLYGEVSANCDGVTVSEAFADAGARRQGYFTANVSGYVTVSASYSVTQVLRTELTGETADGHSTARLRMIDESGWDMQEDSFHDSVSDGLDYSNTRSGTLTVRLWYDAGETGFLECEVGSVALAVPEPATLGLLAVGGLTLLRRRR
jgi:hypothetical protein